MAIVAADIVWRLSGGAGNTDPALSLGGAMSTAAGGIITKTKTLNSIFDDISGTESAAGGAEYRCIYITNTHASLGLLAPKIYISTNVENVADMIDIGVDLAGVDANADTISDESTAPDPTVTFAHNCTSYATGVALSATLTANGGRAAIWIRRTVTAGMTADDDEWWTTEIGGDSSA